jgi:SAM-dependent methyltransferase
MELLDLACGHGRLANRPAARGCQVTGLDASPPFLDHARCDAAARGVDVDYLEGDMRRLPWTARFDRVVNWFTAFGYFDDAGNRQVLTEVARCLKPGGRFALELQHRDWIVGALQPAVVVERDDDLLIDRNRFEPLTGRIVSQRTIVRGGRVRRLPFLCGCSASPSCSTGCLRSALPPSTATTGTARRCLRPVAGCWWSPSADRHRNGSP